MRKWGDLRGKVCVFLDEISLFVVFYFVKIKETLF